MITPSKNTLVQSTQNTLKKAVQSALERKKKLGQYNVMWKDNKVVTQGEDAPQIQK